MSTNGTPMLDEYQQRFCEAPDGNVRLLAPAGSGKTHSLLWRCRHLHEVKSGSARFLIVTFTRAARDELRKRLAGSDFSQIRNSIEIATLNSWGYRRVRQRHTNPRLLTGEQDRQFCARNALQPVWRKHPRVQELLEAQPFQGPRVVMDLVDLFKSMGFLHRGATEEAIQHHLIHLRSMQLDRIIEAGFREMRVEAGEFDDLFSAFALFWIEASEQMIGQALFTLEDQKYVAYLDLLEQIEAGRRPVGAARYTHLLIDEFQDINPLDLALLKAIAEINSSNVTIVGDDDQAIFEWRGATFRYILDPATVLGRSFETHILERNYRCPRNIVEHSKSLIGHNKNRVWKRVEAMQSHNAAIDVMRSPTFTEGIDRVIEEIKQFRADLASGRLAAGEKFALISRKRAQLIPYQIVLASLEIPFCAAEDLQVFMSKAFQTLISLLTICEDRTRRLRPRQIEDAVLVMCDMVKRFPLKRIEKAGLSSYLSAASPRTLTEAIELLERYDGPLKGPNEEGAASRSFAASLRDLVRSETVTEALDVLGSRFSGLDKDYGRSQEDIFYADPPFFYLAQFAKRYEGDFSQFIEDLERAQQKLAQLPTDEDSGQDEIWSRPIHLMTAIRSKGKEFHTVIILDANDGIWPSVHAETVEQKEQERRLFYVAMTRARSRLLFTLSGRIGDRTALPTPFLAEAMI